MKKVTDFIFLGSKITVDSDCSHEIKTLAPWKKRYDQPNSVQFSPSVVSDSLRPHEPQHAMLPSPSPPPRVHPNPCPLSQWCHPTISSSVVPFSSCPKSFPASGSFQWVSSSHQVAKVLEFQLHISPSSEHPGLISFRMDWLNLVAVQGTLKSLLQHHSSKVSILLHSAFFILLTLTSIHGYWKNRTLD